MDLTALGPANLDGLSEHLIAHLLPLNRDGTPDTSEAEVFFPLEGDAGLDIEAGWQSNRAADGGGSALALLAQSGALAPLAKQLGEAAGTINNPLQAGVDSLRGRTGLTKLNSTLYFGSAAPARIRLTAYFRAWSNPATEVEAPVRKLVEWAVPQELAEAGFLLGALTGENSARGLSTPQFLLPSVSPRLVGFRYSGAYYAPFVIESLSTPLTAPRDIHGNRVHCSVVMSLASLTAMDRRDIRKIFQVA